MHAFYADGDVVVGQTGQAEVPESEGNRKSRTTSCREVREGPIEIEQDVIEESRITYLRIFLMYTFF